MRQATLAQFDLGPKSCFQARRRHDSGITTDGYKLATGAEWLQQGAHDSEAEADGYSKKPKTERGKLARFNSAHAGLALTVTLGKLPYIHISHGYCVLNSVFLFYRTNDGENSTR